MMDTLLLALGRLLYAWVGLVLIGWVIIALVVITQLIVETRRKMKKGD